MRIEFSPDLVGKTLQVDTDPIKGKGTLQLTDGICINGDVDGDGVADIAITHKRESEDNSYIFMGWANDLTIASLRFEGINRGVGFAPWAPSTSDGMLRMAISRIAVVNCIFTKAEVTFKDNVAVQITSTGYYDSSKKTLLDAEGNTSKITKKLNFSGFSLTDVAVTGNQVSEIYAFWVATSGNVHGYENDHIRFQDIAICANEVVDKAGEVTTIMLWVADCNSAPDNVDYPDDTYTYAEYNSMEDVLIRGNSIHIQQSSGMIIANANMGNSNNLIRNCIIDHNAVTVVGTCNNAAIYINNATGNDHENANPGYGNRVEGITITNNILRTDESVPIRIDNATAETGPSNTGNWMKDIVIQNNDIEIALTLGKEEPDAIKISVANAGQPAPHFASFNLTKNLSILDNQIRYVGDVLPDWDLVTNHRAAIKVEVARANEWPPELNDSVAEGNALINLVIRGNNISGAVCSISLETGRDALARDNLLIAEVSDNMLTGTFLSNPNVDGAQGNITILTGNQAPTVVP
jgi:hypothetical protein